MPEVDTLEKFPDIEKVLSVIADSISKLEPQTEPLVTLDLTSHVPPAHLSPKERE